MTEASLHSDGLARPQRRAERTSPSTADSSTTATDDNAPSTPREAARKFEKVLVRQFTKVMTEDMFTNSLAGKGGGNWMESQRDRQREHMTDMITEQLVESNSLGFKEKLMQKWKTTGEDAESNSGSPDVPEPSDLPAHPAEPPSRLTNPPATTTNESQIDHAA
jgi:hypothetical protein